MTELSSHKSRVAELETLKSTRDKFLAQLEETQAELTGDSQSRRRLVRFKVVLNNFSFCACHNENGRAVERRQLSIEGKVVQSHLPPFRNLGKFVHRTFAC